jgi:hypothetical protein
MTVPLLTLMVLIVAFTAEIGWLMALMAEPLEAPRGLVQGGKSGKARLPAVVPTTN